MKIRIKAVATALAKILLFLSLHPILSYIYPSLMNDGTFVLESPQETNWRLLLNQARFQTDTHLNDWRTAYR
ncbi:MAG: hypothetical protein KTR30_17170 [Saprospiraceae bacterium]|nr:hypothetical protein [Saprospiraceae bacterium]